MRCCWCSWKRSITILVLSYVTEKIVEAAAFLHIPQDKKQRALKISPSSLAPFLSSSATDSTYGSGTLRETAAEMEEAKNESNPQFPDGLVLAPSCPIVSSDSEGAEQQTSALFACPSSVTFDTHHVANPVVLPPSDATSKWRMFYYGHAGTWRNDTTPFLPSGSIGLAESHDGIHWTKIHGNEEGGAVFAPSPNLEDWDGIHVGTGDVVQVVLTPQGQEELHMYYLGGSNEEDVKPTGMRMRIGRARSIDGGRTWTRMGLALNYSPQEGNFAAWPRIVVPSQEDKPWQMIYHAYNGEKWRVYGATSQDRGETWQRRGELLRGSEQDESAFDWMGTGTRAVTPWRGGLLMIHEGVDASPDAIHRLGVAYNKDPDGAGEWTKGIPSNVAENDFFENGAILQPGVEPMGPWTTRSIGTPYLLSRPDGSLWLYHCGCSKEEDFRMYIGLLISKTGHVGRASWRAHKS